MRYGQLGLDGIEEFMWGCSTCKFCVERCPRGVEIIDIVTAIRNVYSGGGAAAESALLSSAFGKGQPWSGDQAKETTGPEINILFTRPIKNICRPVVVCYDPRNIRLAKATAELLNLSGLSWGIPSIDVNCCGESLEKGWRSGAF